MNAAVAVPHFEAQGSLIIPGVVECLLPTGIYIQLAVNDATTLANLKLALWKEAQKYPLFHRLEKSREYVFVGISSETPYVQEFYDESRCVRDLRLFLSFFQLKEVAGNRQEKEACQVIGEICAVPVVEFDDWTDQDSIQYRCNLLSITKQLVQFRKLGGSKALAAYFHPAQLESAETFKKDMSNALEGDVDVILVSPFSKKLSSYTVRVDYRDMPNAVVFKVLRLAAEVYMDPANQASNKASFPEEHYEDFVLKICGRESYFLKEQPFIQYKYIRHNLAYKRPIKLTLVLRKDLDASLNPEAMSFPNLTQRPPAQAAAKGTSIWECHRKFRVRPTGVMKLNARTVDKFFVRLGIFHGTELLCKPVETLPASSSNPRWNDWLEFDLYIRNIPRAAKLCMAVCASVPRKRRDRSYSAGQQTQHQPAATPSTPQRSSSLSRSSATREHVDVISLAWANINMFSSRGELVSEPLTIPMWSSVRDFVAILNPCGQPGINPNKENAGHVTLRFDQLNVAYPAHDKIVEYALQAAWLTPEARQARSAAPSDKDITVMRLLAKRDPLYELTEQEKELLWKNRYFGTHAPECLPKLISAVRWQNRDEVAEMYAILSRWPVVSPVVALELLDCKYPDLEVRKFAIKSLERTCSETELEYYLLQLVQVLKYDIYIESPIASFLVRCGVQNRRLGHLLFWLLRAEIHDANVQVRFGCILEALCRNSKAFTQALARQSIALGKLKDLSEMVVQRDEGKRFVTDNLKMEHNFASLTNFCSPLDCDDTLGQLDASACGVLSSAKRPLWLVWSNPDPLSDFYFKKHEIIFKNGDDLRQDMLTLQVLGLMDNIWQTEDLNLRLIPYGCLPTGKNLGVIEVVRNARTVMQIQKEMGGLKGTMQADSTAILKWLKQRNPTSSSYDTAVDNFTHSCAGYCVATFILGIGDRHPDNIMVTQSGQMFHIDFGHFLGHFKKKFGISRERVPFVLTADFIHVIARGSSYPEKTAEYQKFVRLCCNAYEIMRKHSNLIITLFTMMLSTGIPELQTFEDVSHLRNALAVDKPDEEALNFFKDRLTEAYVDAWTTKVDWFFHGMKHL